jgi:hypothetical protein
MCRPVQSSIGNVGWGFVPFCVVEVWYRLVEWRAGTVKHRMVLLSRVKSW